MTPPPLDGVRVIELATVIMGPYACRQLADLGADVVKVEDGVRDQIRSLSPQRHPGMSGVTLNLHRNKRSIRLDLKSEVDMARFHELLGDADVLVTTMRPAALERLGLSSADLRERYPRLIHARAAGFRGNSERANAAAYDDLVQAASGIVWLNEQVTGEPQYLPTILADKVCGLMLAQSVLAGLLQRDHTGHAPHIEVPMVESMLEFTLVEHLIGAVFEPPEEPRFGYNRVLSGQRRACRTADGSMCVLPYSDRNWRDFFGIVGRPDLAADPRFATMPTRVANADDLYRILGTLTGAFTTAELQRRCDELSIPAYPVESLESALDSDYIRSGDVVCERIHPTEGPYRTVGPAARFDGAPLPLRRHAPNIGEHTDEVLGATQGAPGRERRR
ncbi:CaiB/BaiF CoA transferase family protein [Millisia brevis]|uniref:CaiB/BaiF CoA transferase family protein n=1 Tax=Millisia brevis TaxID=264148 RepID=UPI000835BCD1|nr:CoA transferase [Millisia brevis]